MMTTNNMPMHRADAQVRTSLLWEYDLARFDWQKMRTLVVQRVVERGRRDDFYAILNLYGLEGVREGIREIPTLNPKDRSFVCTTFHLKKEELKCCTQKPIVCNIGTPETSDE